MASRAGSAKAVRLACVGIGLLFLVRGAFQPYFFPFFERLAGLSYARIAVLLNGYLLAQTLGAPAAGWYADRTSVRVALGTGMALGIGGFLLTLGQPGVVRCAIAVSFAGLAFVLGKIAFNTILVRCSSESDLRRSVASRATLLNLGSFTGNTLALYLTSRIGYPALATTLGVLHALLAIGFAAPREGPPPPRRPAGGDSGGLRALVRDRAFLADGLRLFSIILPYGCWGTIIPKYLIDLHHSNEPVWTAYLTSLCTTMIGSQLLARYVSGALYRRGFQWEWWTALALSFFCAGLLLLGFASRRAVVPVAVAVFICGEVIMTPCFDETAKRHGRGGTATCLGLLHLVDGGGRILGAAAAIAFYGVARGTVLGRLFWPLLVAVFLVGSLALHGLAYRLGQRRPGIDEGQEGQTSTSDQT
jgi:MFS family permease